jgi:hypothetical protein
VLDKPLTPEQRANALAIQMVSNRGRVLMPLWGTDPFQNLLVGTPVDPADPLPIIFRMARGLEPVALITSVLEPIKTFRNATRANNFKSMLMKLQGGYPERGPGCGGLPDDESPLQVKKARRCGDS